MPEIIHGIDVSNYQPRDLSGIIAEHRPGHVVVRMFLPEERPPQEHSMDQIKSARSNGCSVGTYVWAYRSLDPRKTVRDAIDLARRCELEPPVLWIDCETYVEGGEVRDAGPDAEWLRTAVDECRVLGVQPGIYTGAWWWRQYMSNSAEFADLPLWTATYDEVADLGKVALFGGWTRAGGKQYSEQLPDGRSLDRNVFLEEVCVARARPTNETLERLAEWQTARKDNGEDPYDYAAFRQHLVLTGAPDPGTVEFDGFRGECLEGWKRERGVDNRPPPAWQHRVSVLDGATTQT